MIDGGSAAFLQQAHRNNWQQYLASLKPETRSGWDTVILTASDERQAAMYRRQLEWRAASGLLPARTRFQVLPDPGGRRIGSGGATLRALSQLSGVGHPREGCPDVPAAAGRPEDRTASRGPGRTLLIHSGGDSRRLPHCSATGKLFARVPRSLPDGRWSTVFDEFLISLSGLAGELPPGVLVASGDVLLVFDHLQLTFQRGGVIGVAAAAPVEMGARHGVYVAGGGQLQGDGRHRVRAYLHKATAEELGAWGAVNADGTVQIDTGLVWLDAPAASRLVRLAEQPALATPSLNLYRDLLLPVAQSTSLEDYLSDTSDGPATAEVQAARRVIWGQLRGLSFTVERLQPAVFVHFGTSREYWEMAAGDPALAHLCGWSSSGTSHLTLINGWVEAPRSAARGSDILAGGAPADGEAPAGAELEASSQARVLPALVTDSHLRAPLRWQGAALVASVLTDQPLCLPADTVLHQLPLGEGAYVTRVFGLGDDPKQAWDTPAATVFNRPWADWLEAARISPELLWPRLPATARSLWTARLYPVCAGREESLALSLPLADPAAASAEWRHSWEQAERLSLAESFARADGERILADLVAVEDQVAVGHFCAAVEAEQPAAGAARLLGSTPVSTARRAGAAAAHFAAGGPIPCLRGYRALAEATGDGAWEDRALSILAGMIERATPQMGRAHAGGGYRPDWPALPGRVRALASARIDFGGGWSDTPPYSIERGGTVLNAALTLRGAYPIVAEAEWLDEPRLVLESRDIDASLEPACLGELLAYTNPADPFALPKAALVLRGLAGDPAQADPARPLADVMRAIGRGLHLSTGTAIPRGSGLGTSSIMAGAVLACLGQLLGVGQEAGPAGAARLFDEVLCLEQMLTTGGGWQDQVGGLTGGLKLVTTGPGLPQRISITPLRLSAETEGALAERLLLVYTGQQRLAKNLLRAVMGRWMARDPEMVWLLGQIAQLAQAMRYALEAGDVACFGALLSEHWALNKRMDAGCTNPFIDELMTVITPYIHGAKLAGAGGGGFVMAVARDADAVRALSRTLAARYPGTPVTIWPCAVPAEGLLIQPEQSV
jgi:fucokinase